MGPKGFMPAAVFLIFLGKAFPGKLYCAEREMLRTPVLEAEEEPLVLPGFPGSSQSAVSAWERPARSHHILELCWDIPEHGVLLSPLQMEQMSPPFPHMRQCGV